MSVRTGSSAQATVCPFIAYDDDRDGRASVPDHRHRCFAESPAAPRALAHQAAYCLAASFPACPTFLDWARREAAPARDSMPVRPPTNDSPAARLGGRLDAGPISRVAPQDRPKTEAPAWPTAAGAAPPAGPPVDAAPSRGVDDEAGRAEPPALSWQAAPVEPQRWAAADDARAGGHAAAESAEPAGGWEPEEAAVPAFLASRARPGTGAPADADEGGPGLSPAEEDEDRPMAAPVTPRRAPIGYAQTGRGGRDDRRRGASTVDASAPAWERPRTFQQYPTLRTRSGWAPSGRIPRLAIYAGAVALGVIAMFLLPFLLRGGGRPAASPTPSVVASPSPSPVASPSPTPFVYIVVAKDTLSTIAAKYHVTLDQILKANPSIKDPNKIAIGDQIVIPTGGSSGGGGTITQAPSPSPSQ